MKNSLLAIWSQTTRSGRKKEKKKGNRFSWTLIFETHRGSDMEEVHSKEVMTTWLTFIQQHCVSSSIHLEAMMARIVHSAGSKEEKRIVVTYCHLGCNMWALEWEESGRQRADRDCEPGVLLDALLLTREELHTIFNNSCINFHCNVSGAETFLLPTLNSQPPGFRNMAGSRVH